LLRSDKAYPKCAMKRRKVDNFSEAHRSSSRVVDDAVSMLFDDGCMQSGEIEELVSKKEGVESRSKTSLRPSPLGVVPDCVEGLQGAFKRSCMLTSSSRACRLVIQTDEEVNGSLGQSHFTPALYMDIGGSVTVMVVIKSGHENRHKMSPLAIFLGLGLVDNFVPLQYLAVGVGEVQDLDVRLS
jgi:hypothetical protein